MNLRRCKPETCLERSWNLRIGSPWLSAGSGGFIRAGERPFQAHNSLKASPIVGACAHCQRGLSRACFFFKRSAEKWDVLLLCNKCWSAQKEKNPSRCSFLVGLSSHHHLLSPRRVAWLPSSSTCSCFVFWCVELSPHLCSRTWSFCYLS